MNPQDSAVWRWLRDVPCERVATPPDTAPSSPSNNLKRKGTRTARSTSPAKRQRILDDADNVYPDQSASAIAATELSERTKPFYRLPSSASKRAVSPVRDLLNDLRASKPAVFCELPSTIPLPENAYALCITLTEGLHERVIPIGLKMVDRIVNWTLWETITEILSEARESSLFQQDENAWYTKVVYPMLHLAFKGSMLKVESVQSQTINPELLPIMPNNYRVQKKCDYAFSFHRNTQQVSDLYGALTCTGAGGALSQTMDSNTKRWLLFSGLAVKHENGGKDEALAQLATWIAAGMENTRKLWSRSSEEVHPYCDLPPMVGWTVVGHDWHTWVTFGATDNGTDSLYVVGPWRAAAADTRDVYGAFKLLKLLRRASAYASTTYWPWLRQKVLEPLCSDS
ncbi:hypothetical protein ABOM_000522 [Aspergillus bombycis]|uniref:PD-(D/E)XK nuclease-like domain-containing protein n=1 Tax=Aspergillus bombycis TaxID=109264 RepID=A0A1F8AI11_9EURO|nr:hypothetical protein ABOM_000522 [Aspergillus bombycis]OGM50938.1 hypothetical protein ABOM_000522 [Aspergillus bombycis]